MTLICQSSCVPFLLPIVPDPAASDNYEIARTAAPSEPPNHRARHPQWFPTPASPQHPATRWPMPARPFGRLRVRFSISGQDQQAAVLPGRPLDPREPRAFLRIEMAKHNSPAPLARAQL